MTFAWSLVVAASSLFRVVGPSFVDEGQAGSNKTVGESVATRDHLFSDGIWIDWLHREVALEAKVVLRKGPLELLACSPDTREHESILVVLARPRDIYHAMGLIGLEPGSPVRFDSQKQHVLPPTGESLQLRIRYEEDGKERTVPASTWLRSPSLEKRIANVPWVFAGSHSTSDGRFAGDAEGTIVTLVDFESALIAVGALHTADNDALWLEAVTDAIPPVGTPCRLMISAALRRLEVDLMPDGSLRLDGSAVKVDEIVRRYRKVSAAGRAVQVLVRPILRTPPDVIQATVDRLEKAGLSRKNFRVQKAEDGIRSDILPPPQDAAQRNVSPG
ncbi:MAG: hypothetical protein IH987_06705 [Planctomycetes bacterium]|nr:hypothetical protein [Planctomycetota bacterium]